MIFKQESFLIKSEGNIEHPTMEGIKLPVMKT